MGTAALSFEWAGMPPEMQKKGPCNIPEIAACTGTASAVWFLVQVLFPVRAGAISINSTRTTLLRFYVRVVSAVGTHLFPQPSAQI